jgi:hypothetical protein
MQNRPLTAFPTPSANGRVVASLLTSLLAVAAVTCAETTPAAPPPAAPTEPAKTTVTPQVGWEQMGKQDRIDYMKSVVLPRMRQTFANFSPDRYGKMNCMTCHGDSAADGSFKMPNPRLPKLPSTPDGFKKLAAEKPAVMEFMKNEVKPKMAALLGMPEYNPETKTGFGCTECHTMAQ